MGPPGIVVEPGLYAVVRGASPLPASAPADRRLRADIAAAGERSAVLPESEIPPASDAERGWRWLRVEGPLEFSAVGILAGIAAPLARAGVSILALSTFDTDHVLVREERLADAVEALRAAGYAVTE